MRTLRAITAILCWAAALSFAQSQPGSCRGLDALVGEWTGTGSGQPGQASAGGFSFQPDLQGKVLVRRSFAEYPAAKDKPAYRHDDLTIIYDDAASKAKRAEYFDNEGHVIHYSVETSADGCTVTFLSPPAAAQPGYRLSYTLKAPAEVDIKFEIAPPGKDFATYLNASAHRK
jgi:hypothetical protein